MSRVVNLTTLALLCLAGCHGEESRQLRQLLLQQQQTNVNALDLLTHLPARQDEVAGVRSRLQPLKQFFDGASFEAAVKAAAPGVRVTVTPTPERVIQISLDGSRGADGTLDGAASLELPTFSVERVRLSPTGWTAMGNLFLADASCKAPFTPLSPKEAPPAGLFSSGDSKHLREELAAARATFAKLEPELIKGGVRFFELEKLCLDQAVRARQAPLHRETYLRTIRLISSITPPLEGEVVHGPIEGIFKGAVPFEQADAVRAKLESELQVKKWDPPGAIVLLAK